MSNMPDEVLVGEVVDEVSVDVEEDAGAAGTFTEKARKAGLVQEELS